MLALFACKKKDDKSADADVPDAAAVEVPSAVAPPPPADLDAAVAAPQPTYVVHHDAGPTTDAGVHDAGVVPALPDAGVAAPVDAGRPPDLQACFRTCQAQLTACLSHVADAGAGANTQCMSAMQTCANACRQH
jgi:hypothetical protein